MSYNYHPDDIMSPLFRELSPEEEQEFENWAETNPPPNMKLWEIYHPACRKIWRKQGISPETTTN
jgi:hypothetical protein